MIRRSPGFAAGIAMALAVLAFAVAGCGSSDNKSSSSSSSTSTSSASKAGKVAVLLPDTKSSVRWETQDRKYLDQAFTAAGVRHTIVNAEGDPADPAHPGRPGDHERRQGAPARRPRLRLGRGDHRQRQEAGRQGHRLRPPDARRRRRLLRLVQQRAVGKLQGQGLVEVPRRAARRSPIIAELNGSPTDNNATLFAKGYNCVLDPKYAKGTSRRARTSRCPHWDNQKALTIFEQMLQPTGNKIDGVLAANDGLGDAAISALKARKLKQIPVTGQDATAQGIQNILAGDQCMTVYKAVKTEADAAAGWRSRCQGRERDRPTARRTTRAPDVPSVLLEAGRDHEGQLKDSSIKDGFLKRQRRLQRQVRDALHAGGHLETSGRGRGRAAPRSLRPDEDGGQPSSEATPLLELRGVSKSFGAVQALDDVDFHAPRRGHGPRRRQRRRQVDADQVRSPASTRPTAASSSSTASRSTSTGRRTPPRSGSRSSTRTSRSATTSTSSRTCTSAARRMRLPAARRGDDGAARRGDAAGRSRSRRSGRCARPSPASPAASASPSPSPRP